MLNVKLVLLITEFIESEVRITPITDYDGNSSQLSPCGEGNGPPKTGECNPEPSSLDCGPSSAFIPC
jgi:hypothetical protein